MWRKLNTIAVQDGIPPFFIPTHVPQLIVGQDVTEMSACLRKDGEFLPGRVLLVDNMWKAGTSKTASSRQC